MTFISYAQNFEDVVLWRALETVEHGFYIDVGAAHPDIDSVTRAFYERGWRGINIEPVPEYVQRLRASRPEDVTLDVAASDGAGRATLQLVAGTGLSTLQEGAPVASPGHSKPIQVETATLADICRRHAAPEIHFLKIDVEGSERRVLLGADFTRFRPWIVVIEATTPMSRATNEAVWEDLLLDAGYRFTLFDGLNRFYVAAEHFATLGQHLSAPANVMDDFLRVADGEWTRRVAEAEARASVLESRAQAVDTRAAAIIDKLHAVELEALLNGRRAEENAVFAERRELELKALRLSQTQAVSLADRALDAAREARNQAKGASEWLEATRRSSSWRLTAPLRHSSRMIQGLTGRARNRPRHAPPPPFAATPLPAPPAPLGSASVGRPERRRRTVHQFHSGSAPGDAITNAMLMIRRLLRELGYASDIFVQHRPDSLAAELRLLSALPRHDDYVLILHHSMGHDALDEILQRPAPKILLYHNITPPEFLADDSFLQRHAVLGRDQLASLRRHVAASLADSEYNALELRRLEFPSPRACSLLFDLDAMRSAAARRGRLRGQHPFTVLFVGRLVASKAQADLVDAFAELQRQLDRPARLVLVGKTGTGPIAYSRTTRARIRAHRLQDSVVLTGLVSDAALADCYDDADLYVSLSHHEGFGVPLIEAVVRGVPVLAWAAGAIAETLGDAEGLLEDRRPAAVAARMLAMMRDPEARAALARRQGAQLDRFRLDRHLPELLQALTSAGAAPPEKPATEAALRAGMRFTVTGHVGKTYSLAVVNRDLAFLLEAQKPGRVRFAAVETVPTNDLSDVPAELARSTAALVRRPPHATGPDVVISQHYPVYLPEQRGDVCLALFFWEESLIPADTIARLNHGFRAVLAPTRFVAKALIDSGLAIPVHAVSHVPGLDAFNALAAMREARGQSARVFTFLHVSSGFPRKGVDLLLAAYARCFRRNDAVRLVIKVFPNPHNDIAEQISRLQTADPQAPAIELINCDLEATELRDLYVQADVMVLPSRGEGFNLPAAEAMAAGLPLIVTGHGGHRDFCNENTARLIAWRFAPSASHLATPHSIWIEPELEDLASALTEAFADPVAAQARAGRGRAAAARHFDGAAYVERLVQAASHALLTPRAPVRLGWISSWQVRCGIAEYSRHLIEALPRAELTDIVVFADSRVIDQGEDERGVRVRSAWQGGHPGGLQRLLDAIAQEDPQVVMVQHQPALFSWSKLAALLAGLQGRHVVVTMHNTRDLLDASPSQRDAALSGLARCARVLVHTAADLNGLRTLGLVDNVALLPHGTLAGRVAPPPRRFAAQGLWRSLSRPELGQGAGQALGPLIGCYGFFLPGKGIPQLIEALAILRRRWPDARLRLVNAAYGAPASDDEITRSRKLAERLGLEDAVEFRTEFRPDAESLTLLGDCDIVALPYQRSREASSAALRMVLAAGVPVMVTDLAVFDDAREAVSRSQGVDAEALAHALTDLIDDPVRRAALQSAARRWTDAHNWDLVARRLHGMLLGLARSAPASRLEPVDLKTEPVAAAETPPGGRSDPTPARHVQHG